MTPERYAEKLAAAKAELGEKYILRPKNHARRKTARPARAYPADRWNPPLRQPGVEFNVNEVG